MYTLLVLFVLFLTISLIIGIIASTVHNKEHFSLGNILENINLKEVIIKKNMCDNRENILKVLNDPNKSPLKYDKKTNKFILKENQCM